MDSRMLLPRFSVQRLPCFSENSHAIYLYALVLSQRIFILAMGLTAYFTNAYNIIARPH